MPVDPSIWQRMKRQQRSYWPDGHIRIGDSVPAGNGVRPLKLTTFRFSSTSKAMIEAAAELYGGTVIPMTRGGDKWQVVTNADRIPVLLPERPVTQWLEHWDGPYCLRRCDGATLEHKSGRPCLCLAAGHQLCKIHTRVSVLLQDVPSLGTWMLVTKGLNAAQDLPSRAALAERAGPYIDAWMLVTQGRVLEDGKPVTFPIPRIQVEGITPRQVKTGTVPERSTLARRNAPELTTGQPPPAPDGAGDYLTQAAQATTTAQLRAVWTSAQRAGKLTPQLRTVLNALGAALGRQEQATTPATDAGAAPAGLVDELGTPASPPQADQQAEQLRQQIISSWPGTITDLHEAFFTAASTTLRRARLDQLQAFAATRARHDEPDAEVIEAVIVEDRTDP